MLKVFWSKYKIIPQQSITCLFISTLQSKCDVWLLCCLSETLACWLLESVTKSVFRLFQVDIWCFFRESLRSGDVLDQTWITIFGWVSFSCSACTSCSHRFLKLMYYPLCTIVHVVVCLELEPRLHRMKETFWSLQAAAALSNDYLLFRSSLKLPWSSKNEWTTNGRERLEADGDCF